MGARAISFTLCLLLLPFAGSPAEAASAQDVGLGLNFESLSEARNGGAKPTYASFWVGEWNSWSGWSGFEAMLRDSKAAGVTPLVYWYYWGDSISPSCVDWGCNGRTRAEWDSMTNDLAAKLRANLGGARAVIVLENEFNKGGITDSWYAPKFDGYLEAKARALRAVPGVQVVLGFGGWGEDSWSRFPKAIAASDMLGFQVMRASTRDSEAEYRDAPDRVGQLVDRARAVAPGKGSFLYDVALSSYPDARWAGIQDQTLRALLDRRAEYAADGLRGLVYRELRNNPEMGSENYYGWAEQHWGLKDRYGNAKPAWWTWVKAHASPTFAATFTPKAGNEWWVATGVSSAQGIASVCASVNGGACHPLEKKWWGDWAASVHAPAGSRVVFTATSTAGAKAASGAYEWPSAKPAVQATFDPSGNNWWVQVDVDADRRVTAVCASVDGGSCRALALKSWGDWAASFHVPTGAGVTFRATLEGGAVASSGSYRWPAA